MKETQVINRIETGKRIRRLRVENGYQVTDIQRIIGRLLFFALYE